MKRIFTPLLGLLALLAVHSAQAITLSIESDPQINNQLPVYLKIAGLGDGTAPSLGVFDVDILFDPVFLAFNNATFGDPLLGDQLDLFGLGSSSWAIPDSDTVNLYELSFDEIDDLNGLQADSFTLATLTFDVVTSGSTTLTIGQINALGDAEGKSLSDNYSVVVSSPSSVEVIRNVMEVPLPSTVLLLAPGLLWLLGFALPRMDPKITTGPRT